MSDAAPGPPPPSVPVLHAITTPAIVAHPEFPARARAVMTAGRTRVAVHLRTHELPARSLFILAEWLAEVQRPTGAWVIVSDRLDVALTSGVRGAHLPARGMSLPDARRLAVTRLRLGVSVHAPAEAEAARTADWVVAGHVHDTPTHPGVPGRGVGFVSAVAAALGPGGPPVIAIGGITPARVADVRRAGARGVAAIRGLWEAADPAEAVAEYLSSHDGADGPDPDAHGQR